MSSNTSNSSIKIEALSRFSSIPLISSSISLATDGYSRFKCYTFSKAEESISYMASTAQSVIQKLERPISIADNFACQGLDKLQEKVPAINKSPEELFDDGVSRIGVVRKYGTDKIQGIRDYGVTKVNGVWKENLPFLRVFIKSIDTAIDLTDKAVDYYLPPVVNEPQAEEGQTVVIRMSHLTEDAPPNVQPVDQQMGAVNDGYHQSPQVQCSLLVPKLEPPENQ